MSEFEEKFHEIEGKITKVRRDLFSIRVEEERLNKKYNELLAEKERIILEELEKKGWY